ncbi:MAG TPA: glycoside hydrolase family 65 protein, partial [Acidimicrobiia bacterium]|nr:glycoside hydrolase family 65 protein [Acidimicrobiia bacterium]
MRGVDSALAGQEESIFALSNGRLGVRSAWEQGDPVVESGTLVNGFYETWPIMYPETAYGYATSGQTIVYLPDATLLRVSVDGAALDLLTAEVERVLDLSRGLVVTTAHWPEVTVRWDRLVSLLHPELMAARVEVTAHRSLSLGIESGWGSQDRERASGFDPRLAPTFQHAVLIEENLERGPDGLAFSVGYRTNASAMELRCECRHRAVLDGQLLVETDGTATIFRGDLAAQKSVAIEKVCAYGAATAARTEVSFAELAGEQSRHLEEFWANHQIVIGDDPSLQQAVNWITFQLHQATALVDGSGVPAKGLTGQAYEGHVFWDMDVFTLPFVAHTDPPTSARLIKYRHAMLATARQRAGQLNLAGALFPWRTINGEEASAYFEAGTAQYHINADVILGLATYLEATADTGLLWECGLEMAVETARMWADLGFYGTDGRFHIHMVTGPDEYTALVDDNAYTNLMARFNLDRAVEWSSQLAAESADDFADLAVRLHLSGADIEAWRHAAAAMYVPIDDARGITPQDARFLEREPWDWDTPPDQYPLMLHFHPLVIYRHQVLKQADVVMAVFNLPDDFTPEVARANFDFYDPLTTGDSSLSPPVQAGVAAMVGHADLALNYLRQGATVDLADLAGNTGHGVHLAAAGGVWLALVRGFGGFRRKEGNVVV